MKTVKITIYPFEGQCTFGPMGEQEAKDLYERACELYAGDSAKIEIIDA